MHRLAALEQESQILFYRLIQSKIFAGAELINTLMFADIPHLREVTLSGIRNVDQHSIIVL